MKILLMLLTLLWGIQSVAQKRSKTKFLAGVNYQFNVHNSDVHLPLFRFGVNIHGGKSIVGYSFGAVSVNKDIRNQNHSDVNINQTEFSGGFYYQYTILKGLYGEVGLLSNVNNQEIFKPLSVEDYVENPVTGEAEWQKTNAARISTLNSEILKGYLRLGYKKEIYKKLGVQIYGSVSMLDINADKYFSEIDYEDDDNSNYYIKEVKETELFFSGGLGFFIKF